MRNPTADEYLQTAMEKANPPTMDKILQERESFSTLRQLTTIVEKWEREHWIQLGLPNPYAPMPQHQQQQPAEAAARVFETPRPAPAPQVPVLPVATPAKDPAPLRGTKCSYCSGTGHTEERCTRDKYCDNCASQTHPLRDSGLY